MKRRGLAVLLGAATVAVAVVAGAVPGPAAAETQPGGTVTPLDCLPGATCTTSPTAPGGYLPVRCGEYSWQMMGLSRNSPEVRRLLTRRYLRDGTAILWTWQDAPVDVKAAVADYLRLPRDPRWPSSVWIGQNELARVCLYPPYNVPTG